MTSLLRRRQVRRTTGNPIGQQLDVASVASVVVPLVDVDDVEFPMSAAQTANEREKKQMG